MKKFVRAVEHRTFSGGYAVARGQPVLYVTERCVFELTKDGLALIEVAPGIDIEREILAQMEFKPIIRRDPAIMDPRIFAAGADGVARRPAAHAARAALHLSSAANGSSSSISKGTWCAASRTSSGSAASSSRCWRRSGTRSMRSSTTRISRSSRTSSTNTPRWCAICPIGSISAPRATRPTASCAPSSATR